jgi:hypothetical protein
VLVAMVTNGIKEILLKNYYKLGPILQTFVMIAFVEIRKQDLQEASVVTKILTDELTSVTSSYAFILSTLYT